MKQSELWFRDKQIDWLLRNFLIFLPLLLFFVYVGNQPDDYSDIFTDWSRFGVRYVIIKWIIGKFIKQNRSKAFYLSVTLAWLASFVVFVPEIITILYAINITALTITSVLWFNLITLPDRLHVK